MLNTYNIIDYIVIFVCICYYIILVFLGPAVLVITKCAIME